MNNGVAIQIRVISRIIDSKDYSIIEENNLTKDMFPDYSDVFDFIVEHYQKYRVIPEDATLIQKFPEVELFEVTEETECLIDELRNATIGNSITSIFRKFSDISETKSNFDALDYLKQAISSLNFINDIKSDEIISNVSGSRLQHSTEITQNQQDWFIPTGFDELDTDIIGFQRGDELVVLYARTNQGKSWIAEKIATYMVEMGFRIGYFSPEMSEIDIGYRFDTLHGHLSNNAIRLGRFTDDFTLDDYKKYAEELKKLSGKFFVTRPKNFDRKVTISKLRQWIKKDKLDALFIDGITYLTDERFKRGDSKTISLTNISEDLMELSAEMKLPIIVVVQANRGGVVDKNSLDTPELENIRDSDGIAQNASIVYAIRQIKTKDHESYLIFDNKKMRGGEVGKSYKYRWNIDIGKFELVTDDEINIDKSDESQVRDKKEPTGGRKRKREQSAEDDY